MKPNHIIGASVDRPLVARKQPGGDFMTKIPGRSSMPGVSARSTSDGLVAYDVQTSIFWLPMAASFAAGRQLTFFTTFDKVAMTVFVTSPQTTTLPVRRYEHIIKSIDPLIASLSATLTFITKIAKVTPDRLFGLNIFLMGKGKQA